MSKSTSIESLEIRASSSSISYSVMMMTSSLGFGDQHDNNFLSIAKVCTRVVSTIIMESLGELDLKLTCVERKLVRHNLFFSFLS